eukprot:Skav208686  [mRNA]  locus=scaffold6485:5455:10449:+ [translate_table: standard]
MLAETSAIAQVQFEETSKFRRAGFRSVWGHPVGSKSISTNHQSHRGIASGVSIHSTYPLRKARGDEDTDWEISGRCLHSFVRLGAVELQLVVVYGFPSCAANSRHRTNLLLQHAINLVRQNSFPFIIAGDWNHPVDQLDAFQFLTSEGCITVQQWYTARYGEPLPPTFGTSTTNDMAILTPQVAALLSEAWVDSQQLLAGHHPLCFKLTLPQHIPTRMQWHLPAPMFQLQPDARIVSQTFEALVLDQTPTDTLTWSGLVEEAVDQALRMQHADSSDQYPVAHLPRSHRGRDKHCKLVAKPLPHSIRDACHGQHTPQVDHPTFLLVHRTRQIRRVQSLRHVLHKAARTGKDVSQQISQEWRAIVRAPGYFPSFSKWLLNHPEVDLLPSSPDVDFLQEVEHLLRHDLDHWVHKQQDLNRQHVKYLRDLDLARYGKQQAFRKIREPSPGLVSMLEQQITVEATILQPLQYGLVELDIAEQVPHARELGYIMHYRCRQHRKPQNERHQATLIRLKKLARLPLPLRDKAHIIQSSCLTKALFGVHTYYAGAKYFSDLRTGISRCLVGEHGNTQPYLATMCLDKAILDPELVVILQALKAARSYCMSVSDADALQFLRDAARFLGHPVAAFGPASALSLYVAKLGWQLTATGSLIIVGSPDLDLRHTNWPVIFEQAVDSWMEHLALQLTNRHGLQAAPPVQRDLTVRIFQQLPESHQPTVALAIVGGYMLNSQKQKFEAHDGHCDLCGQPDSYEHRTLQCPMTDHVRQKFPEVLSFLREHDPIYLQLPCLFRFELLEFVKHVRVSFPELSVTIPAQGLPDFVFSDGSCHHGNHPECSYAAFALVYPILPTQELLGLCHHTPSQILAKGFATLFVGQVPGTANIPRAELYAAVLLHEHAPDATVVTDSAYVIACQHKVIRFSNLRHLHLDPNYDLLLRWHRVAWRQQRPIRVLKVKAHQTLGVGSRYEQFLKLGNAAADEAATTAAKQLARPFTQQLDDFAKESRAQQVLFSQYYRMLYELGLLRVHLEQPEVQVPPTLDPQNFAQQLRDWHDADDTLHQYHAPDDLEVPDCYQCSHWGTRFTHLVHQWLEMLQWPTQARSFQPGAPPVGITWIELTINFWLLTQQVPLVNIPIKGRTRWVDPTKLPEHELDHFAFTQLANSLQRCVSHFESLCKASLLPKQRTKVTSLHWLGLRGFRTGMPCRPRLRDQQRTMDIVVDYMAQQHLRGETGFLSLPVIPAVEPQLRSELDEPTDGPLAQQARLRHW